MTSTRLAYCSSFLALMLAACGGDDVALDEPAHFDCHGDKDACERAVQLASGALVTSAEEVLGMFESLASDHPECARAIENGTSLTIYVWDCHTEYGEYEGVVRAINVGKSLAYTWDPGQPFSLTLDGVREEIDGQVTTFDGTIQSEPMRPGIRGLQSVSLVRRVEGAYEEHVQVDRDCLLTGQDRAHFPIQCVSRPGAFVEMSGVGHFGVDADLFDDGALTSGVVGLSGDATLRVALPSGGKPCSYRVDDGDAQACKFAVRSGVLLQGFGF
jgi:hypothetical protein